MANHVLVLEGVWEGKVDPGRYFKRIKISNDFQNPKNYSSRASWSRLGPILEHFGGHLGVQICALVLAGVVFGEKSRF